MVTGAGSSGDQIQTSFRRVMFDGNSNMPAEGSLDPTSEEYTAEFALGGSALHSLNTLVDCSSSCRVDRSLVALCLRFQLPGHQQRPRRFGRYLHRRGCEHSGLRVSEFASASGRRRLLGTLQESAHQRDGLRWLRRWVPLTAGLHCRVMCVVSPAHSCVLFLICQLFLAVHCTLRVRRR